MSKGSVRIGEGSPCAKWARPLDRYGHGAGWKPRPAQPYWFTYWDRCPHCGHIQHYEEAKRFPGGAEGTSKPARQPGKRRARLSGKAMPATVVPEGGFYSGSEGLGKANEMRCLSVRQPWAWAIIYAGKTIENRTW